MIFGEFRLNTCPASHTAKGLQFIRKEIARSDKRPLEMTAGEETGKRRELQSHKSIDLKFMRKCMGG